MFSAAKCWCAGGSTSQMKGLICGGNASVDILPAQFNSITQ